MKKITIVHVDDQIKQLDSIKKILADLNNVALVKQFTDAVQARDFILSNNIDLAILDIEMPQKNGLWLAEEIKNSNTLIAFLTSHPEYTLKAFEACAIHYILKPVTKVLLEEIIKRYNKIKNNTENITTLQNNQIAELAENYLNKTSYPKRIFINNIHKTTILHLEDILYMVSSGSYTLIKTKDGEKLTSSKLLKIYCDALQNHPDFVRIHRAHFINKKYIKAILRNKHKISALMIDDEELEISPQKREVIYEMLGR